jgi:thiamine biosynthesis lipoprotein
MHIPSPLQHTKALMVIAMGAFLLLGAPGRAVTSAAPIHTLQGATMGTSWQVQIASPYGRPTPDVLLGQTIIAELDRLDKVIFSTYAPDSELSRLNSAAVGEQLATSRELQEVLLLARTINRQSFGSFDVTIAPLVNLWGFGPVPAQQRVPEAELIAAAKARLGSELYHVDTRAGTIAKSADIALDLSAIAKGYAVDQLAELLLEQGFSNFLIEIGGEVRVQGMATAERDWSIALETPQSGERTPFARVRNSGQGFAIASSGDYRNFFELDGKRYSHEIDPRTGYPIDHALAAVTVLADTAAEADAWATALMVWGPVDGPALAEHRGIAAYFIIRGIDGWESRYTPGFEPYLMMLERMNGEAQF